MRFSTSTTLATLLAVAAPTIARQTLRGGYESAISELREQQDHDAVAEEQEESVARSLKKGQEKKVSTVKDDKKYKADSTKGGKEEKKKEEKKEAKGGKEKEDKDANQKKSAVNDRVNDGSVGGSVGSSVGTIQGSLNKGGFIGGQAWGTKIGYNEFLKTYKKKNDPMTGQPFQTWPPPAMISCESTTECISTCCCLPHGPYQYCVETYTSASVRCLPN